MSENATVEQGGSSDRADASGASIKRRGAAPRYAPLPHLDRIHPVPLGFMTRPVTRGRA